MVYEEKAADFGFVIPTMGESKHLDACLNSISSQAGDFKIEVRVQNGGANRLTPRMFDSFHSKASNFSLVVFDEPDSGPADAINRGFSRTNARIRSWLGDDDFLLPGALAAVYSLMAERPDIQWVTGQRYVVSENDVFIPDSSDLGVRTMPMGFARDALAAGFHAGLANHGVIQQEGTFWTQELWLKSGGLNPHLRYAFDFDLWTKMAVHEDLVEVAAPLAAFRIRKGQLSENLDAYNEEKAAIQLEAVRRRKPPSGFRRMPVTIAIAAGNDNAWKVARSFYTIWAGPTKLRLLVIRPLQFAIREAGSALRSRFPNLPLTRLVFRFLLHRVKKFVSGRT